MPHRFTVRRLYNRMENDLKLNLVAGKTGLDKEITAAEINRPGLVLCGYFEHFAPNRIQVFGKGEISYLQTLSEKQSREILEKMFSYNIPCAMITSALQVPSHLVAVCDRTDVPLFLSQITTSDFVGRIIPFLQDEFGPTEVAHATFVDINGVGVLIFGKSGIGKSECALELIRGGHRLVADDVVILKRVSRHKIFGSSPQILKHHMEVRGIGVLDILSLFGVESLRPKKRVDMVVTLELWDEEKDYNRSGLNEEFYEVLGEKLPQVTIPVQPGRNISIIVEAAAMNLRAKRMGHHSAKIFNEAVVRQMQSGEIEDFEEEEWDDEAEV